MRFATRRHWLPTLQVVESQLAAAEARARSTQKILRAPSAQLQTKRLKRCDSESTQTDAYSIMSAAYIVRAVWTTDMAYQQTSDFVHLPSFLLEITWHTPDIAGEGDSRASHGQLTLNCNFQRHTSGEGDSRAVGRRKRPPESQRFFTFSKNSSARRRVLLPSSTCSPCCCACGLWRAENGVLPCHAPVFFAGGGGKAGGQRPLGFTNARVTATSFLWSPFGV
jgi:hypothetical protein